MTVRDRPIIIGAVLAVAILMIGGLYVLRNGNNGGGVSASRKPVKPLAYAQEINNSMDAIHPPTVVAIVNGRDISGAEVIYVAKVLKYIQYQDYYSNTKINGKSVGVPVQSASYFLNNAIKDLVTWEVIYQYAEQHNIAATPREAASNIAQVNSASAIGPAYSYREALAMFAGTKSMAGLVSNRLALYKNIRKLSMFNVMAKFGVKSGPGYNAAFASYKEAMEKAKAAATISILWQP